MGKQKNEWKYCSCLICIQHLDWLQCPIFPLIYVFSADNDAFVVKNNDKIKTRNLGLPGAKLCFEFATHVPPLKKLLLGDRTRINRRIIIFFKLEPRFET